MADVFGSQSGRRDPPDRHDPAPLGQGLGEREPCGDLGGRRGPVRGLGARMGRDDVPEQHLAGEAQLGQDAVDDRRRGLGRPPAGELSLRRERDPGHPGAAVAGRLAHEQEWRRRTRLEVGGQPGPA
jgi:hypothetical protein